MMYSKSLKLITGMVFLNIFVHAQSDSPSQLLPRSSFEWMYKNKYPDLIYAYDSLSQTHDYSNNWDFDGDGEKDQLFFIGNGGAHLYFHLQIRLSSDKNTYTFPFLSIDLPAFASEVNLDGEGNPDVSQQL